LHWYISGMKYFRTFSLICVLGLFCTSCVKKENYPDYPVITYNSFTPFCSGGKTDSAYLRINFTDGNGQIGYPANQSGVIPDFYIVPLVDSANGYFTPIIFPSPYTSNDTIISFSYQIPNITPAGSDKELNGIIQINLENAIQEISSIPPVTNHNFNVLRFQVWIYDLQGNKSNVITTPTVYTCGY